MQSYKVLIYFFFVLLSFLPRTAQAQSGLCDPTVPFFQVNLTGNPNGTWVSNPPIQRNGNCCGTQPPDKCIEFEITLDPAAVAINFSIASGAVPPGSMFYQIGCGPPIAVGTPICLNGPGPYTLTFCKPGNNQNTYAITSIAGPSVSPDDTTGNGCSATAFISGVFVNNSITWSEITSGTNAYASYLSCTVGCDTVTITPQAPYPAFVDYVVCGTPLAGPCYPLATYCDTIRIYMVPELQATVTPNPASFCMSSPGITLNASITGGSPPYTVNWTNGSNGSGNIVSTSTSYTATASGTYSLVVYDINYPGCPPLITNIPVTAVQVPIVNAGPNITVCAANPVVQLNGAVTNAPGGVWSGGTGTFSSTTVLNPTYTPSATEIASGSVTLTLTNTGNAACPPVTDQVVITIAPQLTLNVQGQVVCFGQTGTLTANVTGGTLPYSYSWSTGATTQTITNVAPGTYTVTITDAVANGCTATQTVTVTQNPQVTISVPSSSIISCNSTVPITISANGGSGNFTYLWSTGATTPSITVPTGMYIITAYDAAGCSAQDTVTILAANSTLTATLNNPPVLCNGATTTLQASASGGFGNYSYSWNTGATTSAITAGAGSYCVTVTDSGGCVNNACITVTQNPPLTVTVPQPPAVCNGGSATIAAYPSGGQGPYTYLWNTGQTSFAIAQPAGTYFVTVTDANPSGCTATGTVTIMQAPLLTATSNSTAATCFGGSNGSATVSPSGGTAPYSYYWPVNGSTSSSIYGAPAGTYQAMITDAIGCTTSVSVIVGQAPAINATITSTTNPACFGGSNGAATVSISGGTPGYLYNWSPWGGQSATATGLQAGTYTVNITDAQGCTHTATAVINQPTQVVGSTSSITNVSCYGGANGSATISATGGTGPYTYYWVTTGVNGATDTGLGAGTYYINVSDAAGCLAGTNVTITQPTALQSSTASSSTPTCYGGSNGTATVVGSGGTPGYTYSWPSLNINGPTATGLSAGTYTYTVTDANGCTISANVTIAQPSAILFVTAAGFPTICNAVCNGVAVVVPGGGTTPYTYVWNTGQTTPSITNLCPGTYSVTVTDLNGCTKDTFLTVTQPPALIATSTATAANCYQPNGTATVNASGGTPGYQYSWSTAPLQTGSTATSLVPNTYTVTVTDINGCTQTSSVTVPNTPGVVGSIGSVSNATCSNSCNGSATVMGTGGSGPYTYAWGTNPIQTSATATGLCSGTYSVVITDNNMCQDTATASITAPLPVTVSATPPTAIICSGQSITLTASAIGGSGNYTFLWNNTFPGASYTVNPGVTTTYTVVATDVNGCQSQTQTVTVSVNPLITAIVAPGVSICQNGIANLTASATGGDGNYSYVWYPGGMTGPAVTVMPTATTNYTVQVSDGCGTPVDTAVIMVTVNPNPVVNFAADVTSGCPPLCIDFTNSTTLTGDSIVNWLWDFGDGQTSNAQTPNHCFTLSGSYNVSLTAVSGLGCSVTYTFNNYITLLNAPVAEFSYTPTSTTIFQPTINFTDQSTDALTWWWNFNDPNDAATSTLQSPAHTYSDTGYYCIDLVVINAVGCTDTTTHCVDVNPEFTFYIPNTFTPNNDGKNEWFFGEGTNIVQYEMWIFDRWGDMIFHTNNQQQGWDGKANGGKAIAQQDVYVYLVKLTDVLGENHTYIGHVSLIR